MFKVSCVGVYVQAHMYFVKESKNHTAKSSLLLEASCDPQTLD